MTASNLVTTALGTGGTTFDTPTCLSGKCLYPLQEQGAEAKVYVHKMVQTQNEYYPPDLNTTLETYDATNAPNGTKPVRSPFDDDPSAYFVGDTNLQTIGNGLISYDRNYATIPANHNEPYGLFTRTLPAIEAQNIVVTSSEYSNLSLYQEMRYTGNGAYYETRRDSRTDFKGSATTVQSGLPVDVNNTTGWKSYDLARMGVQFTYSGATELNVGSTITITGTYSGTNSSGGSFSGTTTSRIYIKRRYRRTYQGNYYYQNSYASVGSSFTVVSVTDSGSNQVVKAVSAPYNLATYYNSVIYSQFSSMHMGLSHYTYGNNPASSSYVNASVLTVTPTSTGRNILNAGRDAEGEVNVSAKMEYRYLKTDDPDEIELQSRRDFPEEITDTSSPNITEYRALIADRTYVNAENEFIERYMGNIYRVGFT